MAKKDKFAAAQERAQNLPARPGNQQLLELYALYKQATDGDLSGSRPGLLDIKGRAKYDAWASPRGLSKDAVIKKYVALVDKLEKELA